MNLFLVYLAVVYILMMLLFLVNWLSRLMQETELTTDEWRLSFVTVAIASLLWPITVPIAYLELTENSQPENQTPKPVRSPQTHQDH